MPDERFIGIFTLVTPVTNCFSRKRLPERSEILIISGELAVVGVAE
jgi:hypothetical protein